jgi:uncharacterized protein (DUF433 family)
MEHGQYSMHQDGGQIGIQLGIVNPTLDLKLGLDQVVFQIQRTVEDLSMRIKWRDYIEECKEVMMGKPVFKGTRLTVEHVLNELAAGMSREELLENYPTLKPEHIQSAMLYAAAERRVRIGRLRHNVEGPGMSDELA